MQNANNRRNKDGTDENDKRIIGNFPVQLIVKHVGNSRRMEYVVRWYGYRVEAETVEPP